MADTWRERLELAIERSKRSERSLSIAIQRSPGYIHGALKEGKQPGVDDMIAIARELQVPATWLLFGVEMSANTEKLLRLYASLSPSQQDDFLKMAESAASLAQKSAGPSD